MPTLNTDQNENSVCASRVKITIFIYVFSKTDLCWYNMAAIGNKAFHNHRVFKKCWILSIDTCVFLKYSDTDI